MTTLTSSDKSRRWLAPALLFALALLVRVVGLTWGLPNAQRFYSYHPDESVNQIVGAVVHLIQGDFNPHFFNYPSLSVYATWMVYQFLAVFGLTTNIPDAPGGWPIIRDIIFAGRLFSVTCGAGTAALSWGIARQLGLRRGAIAGGVLVALLPGLVQHSHYATVDIPATFFVALCVWLALRAHGAKALMIAALVSGLAAGTKYNAGLVVVVPMACALLLPDLKNRWGLVVLAPIVALLGFVLTTPYALIAPAEFWGEPGKQMGFAYELLYHPREGSGEIFQKTGNGWWYHLTFNLPFVMTAPLAIAALIGIGFAARERKWWPVLAFVGLFFLSLGFSQVRFMRYLFPIAPFLCIAAVWAVRRLPKSSVWSAGLAVFALWGAKDVLWDFVSVDPRDRAASYIKQLGAPVALANNPWFYTPPFQPVGSNVPVLGVAVVGMDASKIDPKTQVFVISEFELREQERLQPDGKADQFLDELADMTWKTRNSPPRRIAFLTFYNFNPTLLFPFVIRDFAPHDYIYARPYILVYPFATEK